MATAETTERDLLRRFTDEGDLILGHALETKEGREIFEQINTQVSLGLDLVDSGFRLHYLTLHYPNGILQLPSLSRVLVLKMIEKATTDWTREQLR